MKSSSSASPPPRSGPLTVQQQAEAMVQLVRARSSNKNPRQSPPPPQQQGRIDYCSPRYGQPLHGTSTQAADTAPSAAASSSSSSAAASSAAALVLPLPSSCITIGSMQRAPFQSTLNPDLILRAQALLQSIAASSSSSAAADIGPFANLAEHLHSMLLDSLPTLPAVLIDLILQNLQGVSLPLFVSPRCGPHHGDSRPWSSLTLESTTLVLAGWQLRQIIGWGGEFCNGVQLVFGPPHVGPVCKTEAEAASSSSLSNAVRTAGASVVRAARSLASTLAGNGGGSDLDLSQSAGFFTTADRHGLHHNPLRSVFVLLPDEIVTEVQFNVGSHGDSLRFRTNLGRAYRIGGSEGGAPFVFRAPPHSALIGLCGEVGGHLHNLGTIWASTRKLTQAELEGRLPAIDEGESPSPAPIVAASSVSCSAVGNFSSSSHTMGLDDE